MFSKLGIDYYGQVTHAKFHFTLELWLATMNLVAYHGYAVAELDVVYDLMY